MKKLLVLAVCIMSVLFASAQSKITWSAEVGIGMSSWMGDGSDHSKALFNPRVGVGLDIPLTGLVSFQTGLNWTSKGAKYKEDGVKTSINQNYFEVPLLAAFHVGATDKFDLVFTAGPYIACGIAGKTETEVGDVTTSWKTFKDAEVEGIQVWNGLNRFDAGIQVGAGLDLSRWTVGGDADFGLCKIQSGGPRNIALYFSAGYKF